MTFWDNGTVSIISSPSALFRTRLIHIYGQYSLVERYVRGSLHKIDEPDFELLPLDSFSDAQFVLDEIYKVRDCLDVDDLRIIHKAK